MIYNRDSFLYTQFLILIFQSYIWATFTSSFNTFFAEILQYLQSDFFWHRKFTR
uniref:Uncharacterized protein n=1 Tax=Anguilla anguilla TaxID=7936 RepID=A0A0E9X516_ANGAN